MVDGMGKWSWFGIGLNLGGGTTVLNLWVLMSESERFSQSVKRCVSHFQLGPFGSLCDYVQLHYNVTQSNLYIAARNVHNVSFYWQISWFSVLKLCLCPVSKILLSK